ncbi:carbonyl reductase [NADPH] 1-like [Corticium candelabrum]|uniref:carbonyl reductase [NADPH] 1-like n=1 Tax=Corticium candelabrum TaxID=121492 RepID=UPI002E25FE70|nr:carbonyl reductase [NADPH] 1-like [Corticium candelabrum]
MLRNDQMYMMRQTVWHVDYLVYVLARDQERGEKAYQEMQQQGCSNIRFHALDVSDTSSIDKLKTFIETKYGGLDVLVNNAGIMFGQSSNASFAEQARETVKVNFTGTLNVSQSLLPLLRPHARVVNVGSQLGKLKNLSLDLQAKFSSDDLTVEDLVSIMNQFVSAAETGSHTSSGWPNSAYGVSKVGMMALTRIQSRELAKSGKEDIVVNLCCPGWVQSDMGGAKAHLSVDEGADTPVFLALLPPGSPCGQFFFKREVIQW